MKTLYPPVLTHHQTTDHAFKVRAVIRVVIVHANLHRFACNIHMYAAHERPELAHAMTTDCRPMFIAFDCCNTKQLTVVVPMTAAIKEQS